MLISGFDAIDIFAIFFFLFTWAIHFWLVNHSSLSDRTISHSMFGYRQQWMINMMGREARMVDALIQNSLQQGVLFFASTSILVIGALIAGLGATDIAMKVLSDLPFSSTDSQAEWEIKVLLVVFIFMFAFFKFAWSYRLFNYVIVLIGAMPQIEADHEETEVRAVRLARLHSIGAKHFTTGLNSYFFALAAIGWFINAWVFIVATIWVFLVLYRRAFRSRFLRILNVESS